MNSRSFSSTVGDSYDLYALHNCQPPTVVITHPSSSCPGRCPFHNSTQHKMTDWPLRLDPYLTMMRVCSHELEHPDPDFAALTFAARRRSIPHVCQCGCCESLEETA